MTHVSWVPRPFLEVLLVALGTFGLMNAVRNTLEVIQVPLELL